VTIKGICPITKKPWVLNNIPLRGYYEWKHGALIQRALPTLSVDEWEMLMTGTSPEGWELMFAGHKEE